MERLDARASDFIEDALQAVSVAGRVKICSAHREGTRSCERMVFSFQVVLKQTALGRVLCL